MMMGASGKVTNADLCRLPVRVTRLLHACGCERILSCRDGHIDDTTPWNCMVEDASIAG
jgi:hypothetical protein